MARDTRVRERADEGPGLEADLDAMLLHLGDAPFELTGAQQDALRMYVRLVHGWSARVNLVSARDRHRIATRHVLESFNVALWPGVRDGGRLADVGSGAGFPGLPLAIAVPELAVTLIESSQRKTWFLDDTRRLLLMRERLAIVAERAEALGGRPDFEGRFDYVTALGLGPLKRTVPWWSPLLKPGGLAFAFKGSDVEAELREALPVMEERGAAVIDIVPFRWGVGQLVVLQKRATESAEAAS